MKIQRKFSTLFTLELNQCARILPSFCLQFTSYYSLKLPKGGLR